jgi:LPXTG-motif cell wall-anchored protein
VLRSTGDGTSARVARRAGVAGLLITLACGLAASGAVADRRPQPNADELWRSYPLEQKPTTTAPAPAAAAPRGASTPAADDAGDSGPPWAVLAAIAAAAGLLAFVAARRRRRAAPATDPAAGGPSPPWLDGPSAARQTPAPPRAAVGPPGGARAAAAAAAPVASRPARGQAPAAARPQAARGPALAANGLRRTASSGTVCQIRWSRRARRFFAVTVDAEGAEKRLGRSPVVDWAHAGPPEETPEAQAALRQVVKDLRARGWRPLRAPGLDFDERQWYARRFRRPTEAELEPEQPAGETPGPEVTARPGDAR